MNNDRQDTHGGETESILWGRQVEKKCLVYFSL